MVGLDYSAVEGEAGARKKVQLAARARMGCRRQRPLRVGCYFEGADSQITVRLASPGVGWWREAGRVVPCAGNAHLLGRAACRVEPCKPGYVLIPQHREVRLGHFVFGWQVQPDLK